MTGTPTRTDISLALHIDPHQFPGLTADQIGRRVAEAIGRDLRDVGISNVTVTPRGPGLGSGRRPPVAAGVPQVLGTSDWAVNVGKAGSAETVTSNPMTMTSGATGVRSADDRLLDAVAVASQYADLGKLDDDKDKAASRHMRHQQAAIKAVSGARSLLGAAVAEPLADHVRALVSDVDKAASVGAGYASLTKRVLGELGRARRQVTQLRDTQAQVAAVIRNTVPSGWLVDGDPVLTLAHAVCAAYSQKAHRERTVSEHLPQLLARPTTVEHEALFRRVLFLEERIEAAIASGILRTTTGRGWMRRAAQAEEDHIAESAGTYASVWQRFWDDHRSAVVDDRVTPYVSLATLQIPQTGTDNPGVDA